MNKKFALSFSGGKDSVMSLYIMMKKGYIPEVLLITVKEDNKSSWTHSINEELLEEYRKKLGIDIECIYCGISDYEFKFEEKLKELKNRGIEICVFGDIDIEEHLKWNNDRCENAGVKAVMPLKYCKREKAVKSFIEAGFKAVIKKVNLKYLDESFLGRELNYDTLEKMKLKNIDLCGENGEYHTIVTDGPIFKESIKFNLNDINKNIVHEFGCAILNVDSEF